MTALDWIIVALTLTTAAAGYFQGFVVGAATLAGFAVGLFLGARLGQAVVADGSQSPYAPLFGLGGALIGGMLFGSALEALGYGLRRRITGPSLGIVDGLAGAVLSTGVALGLVWLGGSVVLQAPQAHGLRDDIQRSSILRALNDLLPPSGPILNALARFDPFPRIDGPPVDLPAPRAAIARDPDVRLASRGVVKIQGTACGLGVEGSGWVARDGIVVTNAHVVAGEDETTLQRSDGSEVRAQVVAFDPNRDLAVLKASDLDRRWLNRSSIEVGGVGASFGHPQGGALRAAPFQVGEVTKATGTDIYHRNEITREVLVLAADLQPGDSGSALINPRGEVVGVVFAIAIDRPGVAYALARSELDAVLAGDLTREVDTGPCLG